MNTISSGLRPPESTGAEKEPYVIPTPFGIAVIVTLSSAPLLGEGLGSCVFDWMFELHRINVAPFGLV